MVARVPMARLDAGLRQRLHEACCDECRDGECERLTEGPGEPCKRGETAARSGCIPAKGAPAATATAQVPTATAPPGAGARPSAATTTQVSPAPVGGTATSDEAAALGLVGGDFRELSDDDAIPGINDGKRFVPAAVARKAMRAATGGLKKLGWAIDPDEYHAVAKKAEALPRGGRLEFSAELMDPESIGEIINEGDGDLDLGAIARLRRATTTVVGVGWGVSGVGGDHESEIQAAMKARTLWREMVAALPDGALVVNKPDGGAGTVRARLYERQGFGKVDDSGFQLGLVKGGRVLPVQIGRPAPEMSRERDRETRAEIAGMNQIRESDEPSDEPDDEELALWLEAVNPDAADGDAAAAEATAAEATGAPRLTEGRGEPCKKGETAARSGCTPASGEGGGSSAPGPASTQNPKIGEAARGKQQLVAAYDRLSDGDSVSVEASDAADLEAMLTDLGMTFDVDDQGVFKLGIASADTGDDEAIVDSPEADKAFADGTRDIAASAEGRAATEQAKSLASNLEDDPKAAQSQVKAFLATLGDVARDPGLAARRAIRYVAGLTADTWSTLDETAKWVAKGALRTVLGMALGSGLSAVAVLGAASVAGTVGVVPGVIAWWALDKGVQASSKLVADKVTGAKRAMDAAKKEVGREWRKSRRNRARREERTRAREDRERLGESVAPMAASVWANLAARHVTSTHAEGWADLRESARLDRWAHGLLYVLERAPPPDDVLEAAACLDAMGHRLGAMALREGEGEPCKRGERADKTGCIPKAKTAPGAGGEVHGPPTARQAGARKAAQTRQAKRWEAAWAEQFAAERANLDAAVSEAERQPQVEELAKVAVAAAEVDRALAAGEMTPEAVVEMAQSAGDAKTIAEEAGKAGELSADEMATLGQVMEAHAELLKPTEPATAARQVGLAVSAVARTLGKGALAGLKGGAAIGKLAFEASRLVARIGVRGLKVIAAGAPDLVAGLLKLAAWPIVNNPVTGILLGPAALGVGSLMALGALESAGVLAALPTALASAAPLLPFALPLGMIAVGQSWAVRERTGGHTDAAGRRGEDTWRSFVEQTAISRSGRDNIVAGAKKAWAAAWGQQYTAPPSNFEAGAVGFKDMLMLGGQSSASLSAREKLNAGMEYMPGVAGRQRWGQIKKEWAASDAAERARQRATAANAGGGPSAAAGAMVPAPDAGFDDDVDLAELVDDAPFADADPDETAQLVDDAPYAGGSGMDMRYDRSTGRWEPEGPATGMSTEGRYLPGPGANRRGPSEEARAKSLAARQAKAGERQAWRAANLPERTAEEIELGKRKTAAANAARARRRQGG